MKSKLLFLISLIVCISVSIHVVAQQNTFTTVFYDATSSGELLGYSVIETPDSGFFVAGEHNNKPVLIRMDKNGQFVREKQYELGYYESYFTRIIPTSDSNYVVAGSLAPYSGDIGVICMKVNQGGDIIWGRTFDFGHSMELSWIEQTSDQGYIISAYADFYNTQIPFCSMIFKIDSAGTLEWSRTLSAGNTFSRAHIVREMPDSGYMIAGAMSDSNIYQKHAMMIRLSESGDVVWAKKLATSYSSIFDVVIRDSTLVWFMSIDDPGCSLFATTLSGNILWSKSYLPSDSWSDYYAQKPKLHNTLDNGFIFVLPGQFTRAIQTDSLGNVLLYYDVFLDNVDVIPVSDSGYLFLGNGPLWGVELAPPLKPQTGLIKTDVVGQTDDCLYTNWGFNDTISLVFENLVVDTTSAVSVSIIVPELDSMEVWTWDGCIAMTGGVEDNQPEKYQLRVSPNPSNGCFEVKLKPEGAKLSTYEVYNRVGQRVFHSDTPIYLPAQLDLSFLPSGIYLIRVTAQGIAHPIQQKLIIL